MWALDLLMKVPGWIFRSRLFWFIIGANILSLHNISSLYNIYVKECNEKILINDHDYELVAIRYAHSNYPSFNNHPYFDRKTTVIKNITKIDRISIHDTKVNVIMKYSERDHEDKKVHREKANILNLSINKCGLVLKSEFEEGN